MVINLAGADLPSAIVHAFTTLAGGVDSPEVVRRLTQTQARRGPARVAYGVPGTLVPGTLSSPTPTPARTTPTPCATSSTGAITPTGRSRSSGSPPATWATTWRAWGWRPHQEAPPGRPEEVLRRARRPARRHPQPGRIGPGRALRRGRRQDARDQRQASPRPAQVGRPVNPRGAARPGHHRGPHLFGRPGRCRGQAHPQEPQVRRYAVRPAVFREGRQVSGDSRPAR